MSSPDRRLHERALELAATRLDFELAAGETAELEAHLGGCPTCAHAAAAFRTDAAAIRLFAALPSRRVDRTVHAAIAGHPVRSSSRMLVLVAAAALLIVALLGVAAAGAFLLRPWPPVAIVPSPSAPAVVVVSPAPSASAAPAPSVLPVLPTPSSANPAIAGQVIEIGPDSARILLPDGQEVARTVASFASDVSPDGSLVAYSAMTGGRPVLIVREVDSGRQILQVPGGAYASWSPDGTRIAYCVPGNQAEAGAPCPEIRVQTVAGGASRRLGGGWHVPLAWSPDGTALLGLTLGTGTPEAFRLIDATTGADRALGALRGCYEKPVWVPTAAAGPKGTVIAVRDLGCKGMWPTPTVLVSIDVKTGRETRLTDNAVAHGWPAVSPDGSTLAFGQAGADGQYSLVVSALDGTGARTLPSPGSSSFGPAWSPDGRWLLVGREALDNPAGVSLFIVDPASGESFPVPGPAGINEWLWRPAP